MIGVLVRDLLRAESAAETIEWCFTPILNRPVLQEYSKGRRFSNSDSGRFSFLLFIGQRHADQHPEIMRQHAPDHGVFFVLEALAA